jgi:hypothetical protein
VRSFARAGCESGTNGHLRGRTTPFSRLTPW